MTSTPAPAGRWLFRSYVFLAGGLLLVAVLLEFAFKQAQANSLRAQDPWPLATVRLIENRLGAASEAERPAALQQLQSELGTVVTLLDGADVVTPSGPAGQPQRLVDDAGREYSLYRSQRLERIVRIGPLDAPRDSRWLTWLPIAFYLSILIIVGLWLRPLLRDIRILTSAAQRFAADYREPLKTARETTELTSLARNLDEMSVRIGSLIQNQRDLTAALSHEMRTPLARLRFAVAVLPQDAEPGLQAQLGVLNDDIQEIDRLIAALLNYVRLDHPDVQMLWQQTPLRPWLQAVVSKARAPGEDVTVDTSVDDIEITMDARLMELALSNLVVNACRYAQRRVRISGHTLAHEAVLAVEDDGPGIALEERDQVFRAFTRLDTSRNRETGGYGLGLAIVARVAALHGGTASVDTSEALGGARFRVRWPMPSQASVRSTSPLA
jgi:two-component system sensor kinase ParS